MKDGPKRKSLAGWVPQGLASNPTARGTPEPRPNTNIDAHPLVSDNGNDKPPDTDKPAKY